MQFKVFFLIKKRKINKQKYPVGENMQLSWADKQQEKADLKLEKE